MGRTHRYEKEWGKRRKTRKNKRGDKQKPLNKTTPHDEIDEEEREIIAYEEYPRKKYFNNPIRGL